MRLLVVLAVFVAAIAATPGVLAQEPPRPNIPATFLSMAEVELHERDRTRFGEGFFASDAAGSRSAERYDFHEGFRVFHLLSLQRWDLKKEFFISSEDPHDCRVHDLNSSFVAPFAWVKDAHYVGEHDHHGEKLDAWESRFGNVRLFVGVRKSDPNRPVVSERESAHEMTRYHFRDFNTTTPPSRFFNIPEECQHNAGVLLAADPPRPNIPDTFMSEIEVEFHEDSHNATHFGEGFWAHDQQDGKAVERYDFRDRMHVLHVLGLQRYDLHREYTINSEDMRHCEERELRGSAPHPFDWVRNATYIGEHRVRERTLDAWEARFGGTRLFVAVGKTDPNTPVAFERESVHDFSRFFFRKFDASKPDQKAFDVPEECHHE
ncbi:hypothetical protein PTSG_05528 [Salpingoeca rosetta]|uniref:Uncharacterized protein n=1 Tax=Salpingoeca rosetta (strain ATCC 50818 / BSB-021) TaxID=946362 RepID=F2UBG8_SALR5|nr:uncharacterized protein PTSG_05528 [Salpingoeca rosetta]EGD73834.1 hypothetical protein PTSG_05528 [Salpingoeca rosetta]|eukprot:XP_004993397.1 hypothetical protein PTSG_05528 [Salpingoeca rosetta]